jgi:hypothetical protein
VATEPGGRVEPFGRMTPEEPGRALMVLLPTTATTLADVGIEIDGVIIWGLDGGDAEVVGLACGGGFPA